MKLRKLDNENKRDRSKFIQFAFDLYRESPYWVPPIRSDQEAQFNRSQHPFYKHSIADFFVVESGTQVLGRAAVLHNRNFTSHHQDPAGFFYYLDFVEDPQVLQQLASACLDWCRQHELTSLLGARGFSRSSGVGVLVEGFEFLPAMGIAYNYPYYGPFLEAQGFVKETDHLSGYLSTEHQPPPQIYQIAEKVKQRGNFWVKTFMSKAEMAEWIPRVNQVHHEAFLDNPNFIPSTDEEFVEMARTMIQIADPRMIKLIVHGENEVAGFVISYPNISKALQRTKGRLFPFGWADLLLEKKRTTLADLNGVGLLPRYQGLGANAMLYVELENTLRSIPGLKQVEFVQVDERNFKSRSDMENMGVTWQKRHRTYRRRIEP